MQNFIFIVCIEKNIVYCRCRPVKLFVFHLSPYSLIRTCNNVQNYIFRWSAEMDCTINICTILGVVVSQSLRSRDLFILFIYSSFEDVFSISEYSVSKLVNNQLESKCKISLKPALSL
jgi:hypothetical protein